MPLSSMSFSSALPGLWAGCVAAAALAGVALYQHPKAEAAPEPDAKLQSAPLVTTLFNRYSTAGHVTATLHYRLRDGAAPDIPFAALASDRLARAALARPDPFHAAARNHEALAAFMMNELEALGSYRVERVTEPAFYPFDARR